MRRFGGGIFTERASTVGIDCHRWIRASRESGEKRLVGSRGYNRRPPSRRRTRRRAHHSRPKAAQTSNCLIRTPFLRHLYRRVVRVEIGQKPGVVRGTGSSNPSPSSGESGANSLLGKSHRCPWGILPMSARPNRGAKRYLSAALFPSHTVIFNNGGR